MNIEKIIPEEIKDSYDQSVRVEDNLVRPQICLVCDRFLQFWEMSYVRCSVLQRDLLGPKRVLHADIVSHYTYCGVGTNQEL